MTDLLTAVKSISLDKEEQLQETPKQPATSRTQTAKQNAPQSLDCPEDALEALRAQPDRKHLKVVLKYLQSISTSSTTTNFRIWKPSPLSAKIVNELVATTVTDYWAILSREHETDKDGSSERDLLLGCLKSLAGLGAVVSRLRLLSASSQKSQNAQSLVTDLVSLLEALLAGHELPNHVRNQIKGFADSASQARLYWKEFTALISSGKIVSTVAEAEAAGAPQAEITNRSWLADGSQYSAWLGHNIAYMLQAASRNNQPEICADAAQILTKSFSLGHAQLVIDAILEDLALGGSNSIGAISMLLSCQPAHEQRRFLDYILRFTTRRFELANHSTLSKDQRCLAAATGLINGIIGGQKPLLARLEELLSDPIASSSHPLLCRRAMLVVLTAAEDAVQNVMESNMKVFGESLFIKHAPIIQQEACAQVFLLSAGYVHRTQPMFLFTLARSSVHMSGISRRLESSSEKARSLGMCVGTAVSKLIDKPALHMNFDVEAVKTEDAKVLMALTQVEDKVGTRDDVLDFSDPATQKKASQTSRAGKQVSLPQRHSHKHKTPPPMTTATSGPRVIEILSDSEDDDLVPYNKPDSDPEDEEEDPTLINRNKSRAPVYVRDLIAGLQESEDYDRFRLALSSAANLIRRKAGFGKEVSDHATEVGVILAGLGDKFDMDDFAELRLQALIALLISDPKVQAPWFARQAFEGDYSLSQRATLMSAIGLSARELAGYKDEDSLNPAVTAPNALPSRRLPDKYHNMYAIGAKGSTQTQNLSPLQAIATNLERSMIQPLAASAADSASGPSALKVRTFSSRMNVAQRTKAIPNELAKLLSEYFFFPLIGHWSTRAQAYGRSRNIYYEPFLLSTYLKTLSLLLHASGSGTVSLPQISSEFWDLLLSVRGVATDDVAILDAVLFSLLTILEVNDDKRRLAEENSKQLIETQEWVEMVFQRTSGQDKEGERTRMLAAGILMKTREVVEKYQRLLVGDLMDF